MKPHKLKTLTDSLKERLSQRKVNADRAQWFMGAFKALDLVEEESAKTISNVKENDKIRKYISDLKAQYVEKLIELVL